METAALRASNADPSDIFGRSVSLSGDRALVGAEREDGLSNATSNSGAAYVFDFDGAAWSETTILRASNAEANDEFGRSVSLSGDRALIGAFGEGGPTNATSNSGAAYVFELSSGAWRETAVLRAINAEVNAQFGRSVSLLGGRVLVGSSSAAYVFELSSGAWRETAALRASDADPNDFFGVAVSLSGDRALIGAFGEGGPTNATSSSGAAYVFELVGGAWRETAILRASNADAEDQFGVSVALSGDRAFIGAQSEDGPTNFHEQLWRGVQLHPHALHAARLG